MYLYLSCHGIWYYRKCYMLAAGKRKEIKRSLCTKDKRIAKQLATQLLAGSTQKSIYTSTINVLHQEKTPSLNTCIANYIKEHSHLWQTRHKSRIEGVLEQLPRINMTKNDVSKLKRKWLKTKSIATVNKCLGYCSMFYNWLRMVFDGVLNRFDGLRC